MALEEADPRLDSLLDGAAVRGGPVVFLTGPGLLAESGVPTPQGDAVQWRAGGRDYQAVELATLMSFRRMPADVWGWYLHRRAMGRAAHPNPAHEALAALERRLADRFLLVTENVNGFHLRAGNTAGRTLQIHGNLDFARCAAECHRALRSLPEDFGLGWPRDRRPDEDERQVLTCERCGDWLRPHVLWYDEPYDEERFRGDTALRAASSAALLVVVGTTGAPMLPTKMCQSAVAHGVPVIAIHSAPAPLAEMAAASRQGLALTGTASALVPPLCARIAERIATA